MTGPIQKGDPEISIVMAAYNAASFISASLTAALAQNHRSFEVIVVDDGSSDATEQICGKINDPRLRYLRRDRIGFPSALNEGISLARGRYIAINDADDLSLPHRLSYVVAFFKAHPDVAVTATAYAKTSEFHQSVPEGVFSPGEVENSSPVWIPASRLYRGNPFVHSTLVFPKSIWESAGRYDEKLSMCVDYDFVLRAARFGRVVLLPGRTVLWYTNPTSFFKKKSTQEYRDTLTAVKVRARRLLNLPFWVRLYDMIPIYRRFLKMAMRIQRQS
ncbi:MAG: glycosyltransferase [Candidatus Manganitrophus sp. SA1]|nr:glycosyltransferase [Candidatus Manganitrophus morganii]